ncbi:ABC transporter ATP-binding protein [Methanothrix sp.]|uniref:ABC transporter ATP-binding protein n=1 Tax=Methanothrix sp. TaxID=90426 RepID=UPI00257D126A|nr:ABC transporter ATP-binding protein [Methanothrix sp.]NPU88294.1 ABC transporter ATP-binding protein [Methanothrix sp.]
MSGIEAIELCFSYGNTMIIRQATFELQDGEILSILGPNGCGKTTLLKCINMLLKPEGKVLVDTIDLRTLNARDLAMLMGYVPQMHSPGFPYKVIDVVVSGRTPRLGFSVPSEKDYEIAGNALNRVGVSHLADKFYTQLSGGELKLVLIARALVQEPKVLLLDEPTSHLDFKNRIIVLKILREIADDGIAVIMSEHDPNLASLVSDKVLLMRSKGDIIGYGNPKEILTPDNIVKVYGLNIEIFERGGSRYIFPIF